MNERNAAIQPNAPSLGATLRQTFDLARRVAADELRLVQLESQERIESAARRSGWVAFGALCLLIAWVALLAATVVALGEWFALEWRLLGVAASQLVLGAGLVAYGLHGRRGS